jgi:transposase
MANYLTMPKKQHVLALLALGWSYRRIQAETGVRRETVSGYDRQRQANPAKTFPGSETGPDSVLPEIGAGDAANPAKTFAGSAPNPATTFAGSPRFSAARYHDTICEKLDARLSAQRIWQDLVEDFGYGASYESIKRYIRTLPSTRRAVGVFVCAPGEEGQIDYFRGAPTLETTTGQWKRPWVFRMTLSHSRHGYEEAVWDQRLATFLRVQERAFRDVGGVPRVIRVDNQKVAVLRACLFDPDVHAVYAAFAQHWGFTPLPIQPRRPQQNGKQERAGGYVKDNALKGHRFDSLEAQNAHLRQWNRTIARLRIHGTTRRQVWTHFLETEQPALQPLVTTAFAIFESGTRTVHPDGHVEVAGAYYPMPHALLGRDVRAEWDRALVRVFDGDTLVAVHAKVPAGLYAPTPGGGGLEPTTRQRAFVERLLGRCGQVGPPLRLWAEAAITARGVRAIRLIQGVLGLTRTHPRERVLHAATVALTHSRFRYKDLARLAAGDGAAEPTRALVADDPAIRPLTEYTLELFR